MSSSSSIWHIVATDPDTSQSQKLQDAYVADPDRYLPDLQGGFRVYGHARKHVPPDPSYFYVDDAMRERSYGAINPIATDWMIAYESDNFGQTRILDTPSTRKMRTTMDGMPLGTVRPEGETAGTWQEELGGAPNSGLKWGYITPVSIETLQKQGSLLSDALGEAEADGNVTKGGPSANDQKPPEDKKEESKSGDMAAPVNFNGNKTQVKNYAYHLLKEGVDQKSKFPLMTEENFALALSESSVSVEDQTKYLETFRELKQSELDPDDFVKKVFDMGGLLPTALLQIEKAGIISQQTLLDLYVDKMPLMEYLSKNPRAHDQMDAVVQDVNLIQSIRGASNPKDVSEIVVQEYLNKFKENLFKSSLLGPNPFEMKMSDNVDKTPGGLPIPPVNAAYSIDMGKQSALEPSSLSDGGVVSILAEIASQLPIDQRIDELYANKLKKIEKLISISPVKNRTRIAMDIETLSSKDEKLGREAALLYKNTYGEEYTIELGKSLAPSLTRNELNLLLEQPAIAEALRKTVLQISGKEPDKDAPVVKTAYSYLTNFEMVQKYPALRAVWNHFVEIMKAPVNGKSWWNSNPTIVTFLDQSRDVRNVRFVQVSPNLFSTGKQTTADDVAIVKNLKLPYASLPAYELHLLNAFQYMDIRSSEGYHQYAEIMKRYFNYKNVLYQLQPTQKPGDIYSHGGMREGLFAYIAKVGDALSRNIMDKDAAYSALEDITGIAHILATESPGYRELYQSINNRLTEIGKPIGSNYSQEMVILRNAETATQFNDVLQDISNMVLDFYGPTSVDFEEKTFGAMGIPRLNTLIEATRTIGEKRGRFTKVPIVDYQTAPVWDKDLNPNSVGYFNSTFDRMLLVLANKDDPKYEVGVKKWRRLALGAWRTSNKTVYETEYLGYASKGYFGLGGLYSLYGMLSGMYTQANNQDKIIYEKMQLSQDQLAEAFSARKLIQDYGENIDKTSYLNMMASTPGAAIAAVGESGKQAAGALMGMAHSKATSVAPATMQLAAAGVGYVEYASSFYWNTLLMAAQAVGATSAYASALAGYTPMVFWGGVAAAVVNNVAYNVDKNVQSKLQDKNVSTVRAITEYLLEIGEINRHYQLKGIGAVGSLGAGALKMGIRTTDSIIQDMLNLDEKEDNADTARQKARGKLLSKVATLSQAAIDTIEKIAANTMATIENSTTAIAPDGELPEMSMLTEKAIYSKITGVGFEMGKEAKQMAILQKGQEEITKGYNLIQMIPLLKNNEEAKRDSTYDASNDIIRHITSQIPDLMQSEPSYAIGWYYQKNVFELRALSAVMTSLRPDDLFRDQFSKAVELLFDNPRVLGMLILDVQRQYRDEIAKAAQTKAFSKVSKIKM